MTILESSDIKMLTSVPIFHYLASRGESYQWIKSEHFTKEPLPKKLLNASTMR